MGWPRCPHSTPPARPATLLPPEGAQTVRALDPAVPPRQAPLLPSRQAPPSLLCPGDPWSVHLGV